MGVDYTANYGFGIKVLNTKDIEDFGYEVLEEELKSTNYEWFEVGEGRYSGEENEYYVIVDEPFVDDYEVATKASDLIMFLDSKGIAYEGRVDLVGGIFMH